MRVIMVLIGSWLLALTCCMECNANDTMVADQVSRDLKIAYDIAQTLFTDDPAGTVTQSGLKSYGFHSSSHVKIRILNGRRDQLKILGMDEPGRKKYVIDKNGQIEVRSLGRRTEAVVPSGDGR